MQAKKRYSYFLIFFISAFLSINSIAPYDLDNWNLINSVMHFNIFYHYEDTNGIGFSLDLLFHKASEYLGISISYIFL